MRFPVSTSTTSIVAVSASPCSFITVNSTERPPGSHCGQRWLTSFAPSSRVVSGSGTPPAGRHAGQPASGDWAKTIVPFGPQVAPRLRLTSQSVTGAPPLAETFFISRDVTKPSHSPSGEKNGWYGAPALMPAATSDPSNRSRGRMKSEVSSPMPVT